MFSLRDLCFERQHGSKRYYEGAGLSLGPWKPPQKARPVVKSVLAGSTGLAG